MTVNETEQLLKVLCAHGVTHFKDQNVEIRIEPPHSMQQIHASPTQPPIAPHQTAAVVERPTPPTAAAAPPVDMVIPHHVNEVAKLIKLDDNALAERLFPAGPEPEVEVPQFEGGQ
jgi:hypothetical protein